MKNVYVIPTNKPSRLFKDDNQVLNLHTHSVLKSIFTNGIGSNQNIYITSDEEIKEDYVIAYGVVIKVMMFDKETLYFVNGTKAKREDCKKIILTTDTQLIKDGVQAIDDEFLEWFVKNPSCEWVEVALQHQSHSSKKFYIDADYVDCSKEQYESIKKGIPTCPVRILYKTIIPKEEPKQDMIGKQFCDIADKVITIKRPETLEEAAEINCESITHPYCDREKAMFIKGAKWQAERMYSEEEVMDMFHDLSMHLPLHYEFLVKEKFKNK